MNAADSTASLASAPLAARRLGLLLLVLVGLPWLGLGLGVLDALRAELGAGEPALAAAAALLPLGLPVAGFIALETLAWRLGTRLVGPAALLAQVAGATAARDFRRAPRPGGPDELGRLATACGRFLRHVTRRRQELDWLAGDIAGHALVPGAGARAAGLLAPLARDLRFAGGDPAPAEAWLDLPQHRLLCALATAAIGLAAAPLPLPWLLGVAALALLGGRLAELLRRTSPVGAWLALAALLAAWPLAPDDHWAALAVALAASLALHLGGGWRGPMGGAGDFGWLRGGLAGAVAGGGVAAALVGLLGPAADMLLPLPMAGLVLAALCLGPAAAVATPADWPPPRAAFSLLRQGAVRRLVLLRALPVGAVLGLALGLAVAEPLRAVGCALLVAVLLALPPLPRRIAGAAVALLAATALGVMQFGSLAGHAAWPAVAAAAWAWPLAVGPVEGCAAPRQAAILASLARQAGLLLALGALALAGG